MTAQPAAEETAGPQAGSWVLFATILASSMAFIDSSALNVALPALQRDLGASGAALLWIVNGYNVLLASLMLTGGALGDRYGRKRILAVGIALFAAASLACGVAPNTGFLIVARVIQGIGGALMVPGSLALITAVFNDAERGRAIGTWSAFSTLTTILGPVLGGVLAGRGLWRLIFFVNLPLAVMALAALLLRVPESRDKAARNQPLDLVGASFASLGLAGLTFGLVEAPERGWSAPLVLGTLVGGFGLLSLFVLVEARSRHPMLPLRLFRYRRFSGTNGMTLLLYAALYGIFFFLPLNLIQAQGYSESAAGLAALPSSALLAVLSRYTGALSDRFGPRLPLTVGPAIAGGGLALLALPGLTAGPSEYWTTFFPGLAVFGLGMAITVAPLTSTVMGAVPSSQAGVASGVNNAVSRTGGVLAIAAFGALALFLFQGHLEARTAQLNLSPAARTALRAEAGNLGAAQPPAGLDDQQASEIRLQIRQAFADTFRMIALLAAALASLSAVVAWILIAPQRPDASAQR